MSAVSSNSSASPSSAYKWRERLLIAAALALVGCRLLSVRNSVAAMVFAGLILVVVFTGVVAGWDRIRRRAVYAALPTGVAANAVALAVGCLVVFLGENGLLVYNRLGLYLTWNRGFYCVPIAAAVNLLAAARPGHGVRRVAWLANASLFVYAGWHWYVHESLERFGGVPPFGAILVVALAVVSLVNLAWDTRPGGTMAPRSRRRAAFVALTTIVIVALLVAPFRVVLRRCRLEAALTSLGCGVTDRTRRPAPLRVPELGPLRPYVTDIEAVYIPEGSLAAENCGAFAEVLGRVTMLDEIDARLVPKGCEGLLDRIGPTSFMQYLALHGPGVGERALAKAGTLSRLRTADFSGSRITDANIADLAGLPTLERLVLSGTSIDGSGLAALASLPAFTQLDLSRTRVGDDQVPVLQQLSRLRQLAIRDTHFTDAGVARLQQALPKCEILRYY